MRVFLHCLPAHIGEEVTESVFEGRSRWCSTRPRTASTRQKSVLLLGASVSSERPRLDLRLVPYPRTRRKLRKPVFDRLLGFTLPERHARGRVVRLGPVLDRILSAHAYPPAIKALLAEALVLTALLGGLLKDEGSQLTMQAQSQQGIVVAAGVRLSRRRVARLRRVRSASGWGARRESVARGPVRQAGISRLPSTLRQPNERYQGIVPLEGASLAEAVRGLFRAERTGADADPRLGIRCGRTRCVAGGLLVQHLAEGEEGRERLHVRMDHPEWEHVAVLAGSTKHEELVDPLPVARGDRLAACSTKSAKSGSRKGAA